MLHSTEDVILIAHENTNAENNGFSCFKTNIYSRNRHPKTSLIVGILISISLIHFILGWVEHWKSFKPPDLISIIIIIINVNSSIILISRKGQNHKQQKHRQGQNQLSWSQFYDEHSTARRTYDLFGISFDPTVFKAKREVNSNCS